MTSIPHSTILTIDLSGAVGEHGWMDTHSAARLMPPMHDYRGVVELNIGTARAGFAFELVAEFLSGVEHVVIKGDDMAGLDTFHRLLTYYQPSEQVA